MVLGNSQCQGVLLIRKIEEQGPAVPAVGADGFSDIFSSAYR